LPPHNHPFFLQLDGVRVVVFNKSAHTSIASALSTHEKLVLIPRHKDAGIKSKRDGVVRATVDQVTADWFEQNQPALTVAFVRHPLSRIVSVYNHLIVDQSFPAFHEIGFEHGMAFPDFCDHLCSMDLELIDKHLQPQSSQMDKVPHVGETWIGQVDQLSQHWPDFLSFTGLRCGPVPNNNERNYPPWPTYYSGKLAKMVAASFRRDITFWRERRWPL